MIYRALCSTRSDLRPCFPLWSSSRVRRSPRPWSGLCRIHVFSDRQASAGSSRSASGSMVRLTRVSSARSSFRSGLSKPPTTVAVTCVVRFGLRLGLRVLYRSYTFHGLRCELAHGRASLPASRGEDGLSRSFALPKRITRDRSRLKTSSEAAYSFSLRTGGSHRRVWKRAFPR